jgi:hypothetical protein
MSLIVEDGSVVDNANSYNTVSSAGTYMDNRTSSTWTSASTDEKEKALYEGGMYLNSLNWKGSKTERDQSMEWPRANVYDNDEYLYPTNVVPQKVQDAQVEAAIESLAGSDLFPTVTPDSKIKRKKVDVLEKEFFGSASNGRTTFTVIDGLLKGFLQSGTILARS